LGDRPRSRTQLIHELEQLRQRVAELERVETELTVSKEKLEHQTRHLESLLHLSSLAIIALDEDHNIVSCNHAFENLFQLKEPEIIGKNLDEVIARQDYLFDAKSYTKKTLKGEAIHGSGRRYRKDGSLIHVEFIGVPVVIGGDVVGAYGIYLDISERIQTQSALRESEERFKELSESLPQPIFEIDERGDIIFTNRFAFDLFGYTRDEYNKGLSAFQMLVPEDHQRARENIARVLRGEILGGVEYTAQRKDGSTFPVEIYSSPIIREDKPIGLRGIIVDLTEHRKTEKALRDSEAKYSALVENSKDGIIMIQEGVLKFINKASFDLVGYPPEEMIGANFLNFAAPEYRELVLKKYTNRIEGKGDPSIYEIDLLRKDGTTVPVEINAMRIEFGGKPADLAFVRNITGRRKAEEALRESEERFRVLVEESPLGVSLIGKDGQYKYLNPKFIEIFGYSLEDIPTGREWFQKAYPDQAYRNQVITAWISDLKGAKLGESRPQTFAVTCKDGSEKVIQFRPVTMSTGDQFLIYEDITERTRLEEQLHLAQRMEAIGTLAGGIAHNFNNLLTGIMGNTSLILMDVDPSHTHYARLKNIETLVDSGSKLTNQLLGYARKGRYEVKPISLNRVVRETSETLAMTKKDIIVHREFAEDLHGVHADQGQIEQILWNLYVNATEAMPGGGYLFLTTMNVTEREMEDKPYTVRPGNYALITVRDTGTGIDRDTMEHIFEPFFTTKGLARGTGLGLASVYGMVKAHGGYIDVDSKKGKGTTFSIYLPASKEELPEKQVAFKTIEKGHETLLLVDDEEAILEVGKETLEAFGYNVITAKGGKRAIEIYEAHKDAIDMVILDMIMPDMSGGETYDHLKAINPEVKVLLLSGYTIEGQASEILERGCDGFIQKPFDMREFSQRIRGILDRKE
jgi:two-component system cell cycle sensor histidine kinase/response regulator CckA